MAEDTPFPDDETLHAYVSGSLADDTRRRIDKEAAARPALAAEIALLRGLRPAFAASDEAAPNPPGALGWAKLERAIKAETAPARPTGRTIPLWQGVAAVAASILVWQVAVVPLLPGQSPTAPGYVPVTQAPSDAPSLRVAFLPDAPAGAIAALLSETGARVSDGPSALGLWTLSFADTEARDAALARYRDAADLVESAQTD